MPQVPASRYWSFASIAILGCLADLWTKKWIFSRLKYPAEEGPIWLIQDVLSLDTSLNEGALFGLGQGFTWLFATLSIIAAVAIVYWLFVNRQAVDAWLNVALACVMAGIFGNLYDRLGLPGLKWKFVRGENQVGDHVYAVRDWIHFEYGAFDWPIFNLADSLLVCGAALLVWHSFRQPSPVSLAAVVNEAGAKELAAK